MRDGDVMELLPTLEGAQKYDSEISDWLVSCMIDFLLLQTLCFHVSCTLVGRNDRVSTLVVSRLQKNSSVHARTGTA